MKHGWVSGREGKIGSVRLPGRAITSGSLFITNPLGMGHTAHVGSSHTHNIITGGPVLINSCKNLTTNTLSVSKLSLTCVYPAMP